MLAHSGLALITEKLQNQRLEESPPSSCCNKLSVTQDDSAKTSCQQQSNLAVNGKNVWTLSLESERHGRHEFGTEDSVKALPQPPEKLQPSHAIVCRHKKLRHCCQFCDSAPGTPTAPPKKKHCRSLSVPPDGLTVVPAPVKDPGGKIWKPIAVIPQNNNNVKDNKDRNQSSMTHAGDFSKWMPKLSSGFKLVPVVSSSPSVDSGHYTNSDLQTPPGSPVPRPASTTSDTSFSSLGSAWHDYSPMRSRVRVLENRSLSCEDQISGSSSTSSMPCVHGSMDPSTLSRASSNQDSGNICTSSGIPRCHSQPCVLHHRRCGQKRRRDCDRPTLNFNKMTETAYTRCHRRSEPWNTPAIDQQLNVPIHQVFLDGRMHAGFVLNPIASSPLDSELPVVAKHLMNSDMSQAASIALPITPPGNMSPNFVLGSNGNEEDDEEDDLEEEEEEESIDHTDCNCHDSRTDDVVGFFPMNDLDIEEIESH